MPSPDISCSDACGRTHPADSIESSGWEYLSIQRRYRCVEYWRALREAASMVGTGQPTTDNLPPTSRGALPKETASTIAQPTVKNQP